MIEGEGEGAGEDLQCLKVCLTLYGPWEAKTSHTIANRVQIKRNLRPRGLSASHVRYLLSS